jgi:hypothetical protein
MKQLGFEMGGYFEIAIGLSFSLLGNSLPRDYASAIELTQHHKLLSERRLSHETQSIA